MARKRFTGMTKCKRGKVENVLYKLRSWEPTLHCTLSHFHVLYHTGMDLRI